MKLMRHCPQCRADAVGLLGEDRGDEFTAEKVMQMDVDLDGGGFTKRESYREHVEAERAQRHESKAAAIADVAHMAGEKPILIAAVATKGGERINEHFGHAKE